MRPVPRKPGGEGTRQAQALRGAPRGRASFARHSASLLFTLVLLAGSLDSPVAAQRPAGPASIVKHGLVLSGGTIVSTDDGSLSPDMAIVLDGGRIVRIAPATSIQVVRPAQLVDAKGKFIVPGFLDMHAHPLDSTDPEGDLNLMIAFGVTGVHQMSGSADLLARRKAGTLLPAISPEILLMPGSILLHSNAPTPEAARRVVDQQKQQGADFIKTIDVIPEVFFAALDEAKRQNLPYEGHLSPGVDAIKASEMGMRAIEHLGPTENLLISCSSNESAIREEVAQDKLPPIADTSLTRTRSLADGAPANPVQTHAAVDPTYMPRIKNVVETYSEAKCRKLAQVFIQHDTWNVPTLSASWRNQFGDKNELSLRFATPEIKARQAAGVVFVSHLPASTMETFRRLWALQLHVVKLFDTLGAPMLAGSDGGGGYGLHEEFDKLELAGLSPLTVLQMTTVKGAKFLGRESTMGRVREGEDANLVLLDADPIKSVQNLHAVSAVVRAGTYYSTQDLNALKAKVIARRNPPLKTPASAAPSAGTR